MDLAWAARPHAVAVMPFEELHPKWKVLSIGGANVLARPLDEKYPLRLSYGADGEEPPVLPPPSVPRAAS